jgi:hypothetical protein
MSLLIFSDPGNARRSKILLALLRDVFQMSAAFLTLNGFMGSWDTIAASFSEKRIPNIFSSSVDGGAP